MKVALVTGSVPPAVCGVGDYTFYLAKALRQAQVEAEIVTQDHWGALDSRPLLARVANSKADIVHIQYPTVGYRFGFAPHVLSLFCDLPVVVTLHEFKYAHILRRASCSIFSLCSKHTIFPNLEDRQSFCKMYFVPTKKTSVIQLGSSIPWIHGAVKIGIRICYFGIIRPAKGIEDFIEIGKLVKKKDLPFILEIIGSPAASNMAYYQSLREATASLPIEWSINLAPDEVALRLREATCAYLPFPGGVSMRRSSLVAVMGNGVPVITTDGPDRPPEMAKAMRFASTPEEALSVIVGLMNDHAQAERIVAEARKYLVDFSWPKMAEDHKRLYDRVLERGGQFGYA
jgi:glycosyltransferase involved in cell wall biosynthesis